MITREYVHSNIKGYLHYKTLHLKMFRLRHRLRIILFCRKAMFRSHDIQVFVCINHPMIYKICDVMMSIST